MFLSRLGPAIAAHSAYREGRVSVSLTHSPRAPPGTVSHHQKQPFSPRPRHSNTVGIPSSTNTNPSLLPVEAGCDPDAGDGASGRDPACTSGR